MQTTIDFTAANRELFRQFIEQKKAEEYTAKKVNYTACATILQRAKHRISIYPTIDGTRTTSGKENGWTPGTDSKHTN